ncbi:hypothetical protein [Cucumibacter marinus]|uniref:hypothetical protein n=1 Tax=Cucumibacter marinus TaxID=1121252 RepID=UPI0004117126|nr:hypothetical protein [Cucumibacter marinus]
MTNRRKFESIAFFIPVLGAVVIMPPIVLMFDRSLHVFGFPMIIAFLFTVWMALIVSAWALSRAAPEFGRRQRADNEPTREADE